MPAYQGNKRRVIPLIQDGIDKIENKYGPIQSFVDLFHGMGSVTDIFRPKGIDVYCVDAQRYSFSVAVAKSLSEEEWVMATTLIDEMNDLPRGKYTGFFFRNYTIKSCGEGRMFFTKRNAKRIDQFRAAIRNASLPFNIREYLLASLIDAAIRRANSCGHFSAYLKNWKGGSHLDLTLEKLPLYDNKSTMHIYRTTAERFLRKNRYKKFDLVYLDPPYAHRQYSLMYHIPETISRQDFPEIAGKSGRRTGKDVFNSNFCNKRHALNAFREVIHGINAKNILISYNESPMASIADLIEICKTKGRVEITGDTRQEFVSRDTHHKKTMMEYLIWIECGEGSRVPKIKPPETFWGPTKGKFLITKGTALPPTSMRNRIYTLGERE